MQTDVQKISSFISIAEKVRNSKFIREKQSPSFSLNFEVGKPLKQELSGFDEDDLRSLLLDLRKFTLSKDGVEFTDICTLLLSKTSDQEIIKNINACREQFEKVMTQSVVKLIVDGEIEENIKIIKTWFYGHYFHEQPEHTRNLARLGLGESLHKFNFINLIESLSYLSVILANNAKLVLTKP